MCGKANDETVDRELLARIEAALQTFTVDELHALIAEIETSLLPDEDPKSD